MSMAEWHMDTAVFGRPDFGLTQTQGKQFLRGIGDVGSGEYRNYNVGAPYPVDLSWTWDGTQFNAFVTAWNTFDQLRFGAAYFSLDLPLQLDMTAAVNDFEQRYICFFRSPYSADKIGYNVWSVKASLGVDLTPEPYRDQP